MSLHFNMLVPANLKKYSYHIFFKSVASCQLFRRFFKRSSNTPMCMSSLYSGNVLSSDNVYLNEMRPNLTMKPDSRIANGFD